MGLGDDATVGVSDMRFCMAECCGMDILRERKRQRIKVCMGGYHVAAHAVKSGLISDTVH